MRRGGGPWPGKRVQCNMGAKNHGVIMPDANKEYTINQLVGAAFGAAGQRCMALSTAVLVGESRDWLPEVRGRPAPPQVARRATKLRLGAGHEPATDLPPVISPQAKERICSLVQSAVEEGAELLLDGRQVQLPSPSLPSGVRPGVPAGQLRGAHHHHQHEQGDEGLPRGDLRARAVRGAGGHPG